MPSRPRRTAQPPNNRYKGPSCPEQPLNSEYYGCLDTGFTAITRANTGGATTFNSACGTLDSDGSIVEPGMMSKHAAKQQACPSLVNMTAVNSSMAAADVVVLFVGQNVGVTEEEGRDRPIYGMASAHTLAPLHHAALCLARLQSCVWTVDCGLWTVDCGRLHGKTFMRSHGGSLRGHGRRCPLTSVW